VLLALVLLAHAYSHTSGVASIQAGAPARWGWAKHYSPGVMERVRTVRAHQGVRIRTDVAGYAAAPDCAQIGRVVVASINGGPLERYQVLDCSHPRDRARHVREGLVIEVDYRSAVRNGFARQGKARAVVYGGR
jgi:hypothetical protein